MVVDWLWAPGASVRFRPERPIYSMTKISHETKQAIRESFADGTPIARLVEKFGLGKSTVWYIVKNTVVKVQRDYHAERSAAAARGNAAMSDEARSRRNALISQKLQIIAALPTNRFHKFTEKDRAKRAAMMTPLELSYLQKLQKVYGPCWHQNINGAWFDFVNDHYIIETTEDVGKGASKAIERLSRVATDPRVKILFCPRLGPIRQARLASCGASHINIADLHDQSST